MARRRMISEELIYDEQFNRLSLEAQSLFVRMLAKADDCGVLPADQYALVTLTNPPPKVRKDVSKYLCEMMEANMGTVFVYEGKNFFAFKRDSFDRIQSYVINKRAKSEYLNLDAETALALISEKFLEVLGNSSVIGSSPIERYKQKVESRKQKDKETVPDSLSSVITLFREKGYAAPELQGEKFWNHYSANGWRVGKNPMKDWHAAAANWNHNVKEWENGSSGQSGRAVNGQRRIITAEDNKRVADAAAAIKASRAGGNQ